MVWLAGAASTGALFTSFTITEKLLLSLNGGVRLSVTWTVIRFVLGPCASVGVQLKTPVVGSMLAPAGAPGARPKVRMAPSESVAVAVNVSKVCSLTVWSAIAARASGLIGIELVLSMIVSVAVF